MPLTKAQVRASAFTRCKPALVASGFAPNRPAWRFTRVTKAGWQAMEVSTARVGRTFALTFGLSVRIDRLQALVQAFAGVAPEHWADSASIITSAIYLKQDPSQTQYFVSTDDDIERVCADVEAVMASRGMAWLDHYQHNLGALDAELNADPSIAPAYTQLLMVPYYGIGAAYLTGNPHLPAVIDAHLAFWRRKAAEPAFAREFANVERFAIHVAAMPSAR